MIDVSVRVKDALRDGRRLKEYLFYEITSEATMRTDANGALTGLSGDYLISVKQESSSAPSAVVSYTEGGQTVTETITPMDGDPLVYSIEIPTGTSDQSIIFKEGAAALVNKDVNVFGTGLRIGNDNLVTESVKLDERMCSGDDLKFGLCEGSSLEFQYFGKPSLTDKRIKAYVNVQYKDENGDLAWYMIPMGFFTVDKCPRQASTGIMKVTAYNKLKSDYLDAKANELIIEEFAHEDTVLMMDVLETMLDGYGIKTYTKTEILDTQGFATNPLLFPSNGYDYTNQVGDHGAFGPGIIYKKQTQSIGSGMYFQIPQDRPLNYKRWNLNLGRDALIQIRFDEDLSSLEERIYQFFSAQLDLMNTSWSVWNFKNQFLSNIGGFFVIRITYTDHSFEEYSTACFNHLSNASTTRHCMGTLADINKITITKPIDSIGIFVINELAFGALTNGNVGIVHDDSPHSDVTNVVSFLGEQKEYVWWDQAALYWFYSTYDPPKYKDNVVNVSDIYNWIHVYEVTGVDAADLVEVEPEALQDVTLRDLQSAVFETACQFGKLDRETDLFSGVELNGSRLLPADTIYPATNLYPDGAHLSASRSMYSKLWAEEGNVQSFRYLSITYKGLDEDQHEKEYVLQRTVNSDGTQDYNCSDNWLFRKLIWTAAEIGEYADAMVTKMRNITWFPFEMWCAGLPYLETGDEIEIPMGENTYTSYVLQRTLDGIQNLQDTYINGDLDIF